MNAIIMTAVTLLGGWVAVLVAHELLGDGDLVWAAMSLMVGLGLGTVLWEAWRDGE